MMPHLLATPAGDTCWRHLLATPAVDTCWKHMLLAVLLEMLLEMLLETHAVGGLPLEIHAAATFCWRHNVSPAMSCWWLRHHMHLHLHPHLHRTYT